MSKGAEMKKRKLNATDIVLLVLHAVFFAGMLTLLGPCGPTEDGGWMNCHWAGQAVTALAAALLAMGVLRLFVRPAVRVGIDLSVIAVSGAALCVPGHLISLCMMPQMRCRAVMSPSVTVLSILTMAAAAADIAWKTRKQNDEV